MEYKEAKNLEETLGNALKRVSHPMYPKNSQEILRKKVMMCISNLRRAHPLPAESPVWYMLIVQRLRTIGLQTEASETTKILLRNRILRLIKNFPAQEIFPRFNTFWSTFFRGFLRPKAWSFAVLMLFVFSLAFSFLSWPQATQAAPMTFLDGFSGEVEVLRSGATISAKQKLFLRDRDIIRTKANSSASIHFLDDSVGRLSENSELKIERLFVNRDDPTKTLVELDLKHGRLWARVLSLIDEFSHFQVKGQNALVVAKKKAAFDMSVDEKGKTKVRALQNSLDVTVSAKKQQKLTETTLVNGFTLEVKDGNTKVTEQKKNEEEWDSSWIVQNEKADRQYVEQLAERDREKRREVIASTNTVKAISETASHIFQSDVEKQKAKLKAAEVKLVEAEALLELGEKEKAENLLRDFQELMKELSSTVAQYEREGNDRAAVVKELYEREVKVYQKQFTILLPDSPLYPLKTAMVEANVSLATTPTEKAEKTIDAASEKLMEAQQLAENGEDQLAGETLKEFTNAVEQMDKDTETLPDEEKMKVAAVVLDKQGDHIKLLEALARKVELRAPPVLAPNEQRGILLEEILGDATKASLDNVAEAVTNSKIVVEAPAVENQAEQVVDSSTAPSAPLPVVQTPPPSTPSSAIKTPPENSPLEITGDSFSGITVITIDAKPSEAAR